MTTASHVASAWEAFQATAGGIKRPETEAEYEALLRLADELTDRYNCNEEPHASLFDLIAGYLHAWELVNEPELKDPDVPRTGCWPTILHAAKGNVFSRGCCEEAKSVSDCESGTIGTFLKV